MSTGSDMFVMGERKIQEIDTTGKLVLTELEAKGGVGANNLYISSVLNMEGMRGGLKRNGLSVDKIGRKRFIKTIKDEDIGGELIFGKIIHAFIKMSMIAVFDLFREDIPPIDVVKSARTVSQKDTFASSHRMFETREDGFDPYTTAKGTEASQISFLAIIGELMGRLFSSAAR